MPYLTFTCTLPYRISYHHMNFLGGQIFTSYVELAKTTREKLCIMTERQGNDQTAVTIRQW